MTSAPRLARDRADARPLPRRLAFSRDALAGIVCPPGAKAVFVYDAKAHGLQYVVRSSGFRAFYWVGRVRGEHAPIRHLIGGDETPIEHARKRAIQITVGAKDGVNPKRAIRASRDAARNRRRLGDLWQKYHEDFLIPRARQKTRETHESIWRVWLEPWGAARPLDEIDGESVRALHATIARGRTRPAAPEADGSDGEAIGRRGRGTRRIGGRRTANKAVSLLRRLFNFGKAENPIRPGVVEMFRQHSRERYLTPPELARFFAALADEPDEAARDFIELALFTGARRATIQSMRWDELDLAARKWTIPAAKMKADRPLDVPLTAPAIELLERRRARNDARERPSEFVLWSNRAKCGHITEPKFAFARVCRAAKIRDLRIHDLRRTLGSWQAAMGASLPIIGKSLGHSNINSTAIYSRIDLDPVRASVTGAVDAMLVAAGRTVAPAADVAESKTKGGRAKKPAK